MKFSGFCLAAALSFCLIPMAQARIMREMTYQERFDKADLIVIAHPASKTTDTTERTVFPSVGYTRKDGKVVADPAIGVETIFDVLVVVKGDNPGKQIVLHHLREPTPPHNAAIAPGGPNTVSFGDHNLLEIFCFFLLKRKMVVMPPTADKMIRDLMPFLGSPIPDTAFSIAGIGTI